MWDLPRKSWKSSQQREDPAQPCAVRGGRAEPSWASQPDKEMLQNRGEQGWERSQRQKRARCHPSSSPPWNLRTPCVSAHRVSQGCQPQPSPVGMITCEAGIVPLPESLLTELIKTIPLSGRFFHISEIRTPLTIPVFVP